MAWGPWMTGIEYWGVSNSLYPAANWQVSPTGSDAAALWSQAVNVSGAVSTAGGQNTVHAIVQAFETYIQGGGQQNAVGFNATQARSNPPDPPLPNGASDFEYEVDENNNYILGPYLGGARLTAFLGFGGWANDSHDPSLDVRLELRVLNVTPSALAIPGRAYDASGPTILSTGVVPSGSLPVVTVTQYVDSDNGQFAITSAVTFSGFTPPTYTEGNYYRGASGRYSAIMEYRCRSGRVRYFYDYAEAIDAGDLTVRQRFWKSS